MLFFFQLGILVVTAVVGTVAFIKVGSNLKIRGLYLDNFLRMLYKKQCSRMANKPGPKNVGKRIDYFKD